MITLAGLLSVSLVVLCLADPSTYTCTPEEEGRVLNVVADWVATLKEDYEHYDGALALLAGGYDDHCKTLHIALDSTHMAEGSVQIRLKAEATKLDTELGHAIPRGMSKTMRDLVRIVDTHKASSVASETANSSVGRALRNQNVTAEHLKIIKMRAATMFRRVLQSPAAFDQFCGKKSCKGGTKELMHAFGIKGFKAKGMPLLTVKATASLVEPLGKWWRGQITAVTAEQEASTTSWANSFSDVFDAASKGDSNFVRGTRATMAKEWLHKNFFNEKPKRRVDKCYRDFYTFNAASNSKVSREYLKSQESGKSRDKMVTGGLCIELIRAEREAYVGVDEAYEQEEL